VQIFGQKFFHGVSLVSRINMSKAESGNIIQDKVDFFKESWVELKKVQTPTREETWRATLSVIVMVALFGLFLGFTDYVAGGFVRWLLGIE